MYILNLCREFKSELLRRRAIGYTGCRPSMCTRSAARFLGTIDILLRKLHIPNLRLLVSRYIRFWSRCRFSFICGSITIDCEVVSLMRSLLFQLFILLLHWPIVHLIYRLYLAWKWQWRFFFGILTGLLLRYALIVFIYR